MTVDDERDRRADEESWDAWARVVLAEGDHDPELGVRAARDAQRVVAGDLAEEEFRDRHHDAYLSTFGRDARPTLDAAPTGGAPGAGAPEPGPPEAPVPSDAGPWSTQGGVPSSSGPVGGVVYDELPVLSRRAVLGAAAGAAVGMLFVGDLLRQGSSVGTFAAGTASGGGAADPVAASGVAPPGQQLPVQIGMVIDLERCDGCLTCVRACADENGLSEGVLWPYVFAYQEPQDTDPRYLVRLCQHCTRAPCVMVCPTGARHRRLADGLVLTDYDLCIGCRYCQVACPYGVNIFQWADPDSYGGSYEGARRDARGIAVKGDPPKGVMGKCTFCPLRQEDPDRYGTAACVDACAMNALHIGDLNDPDSPPNRHLAQRREEVGGNLPTFRLLEDLGTEPNIIYIGHPPSSRAELVDSDWTYEDWGLTEDRRSVLEGPEPWFRRVAEEV